MKYLILFIFLFTISGCNLINYPINITEEFLKQYQNLDKNVVKQLDDNTYKLSNDNYKVFKEVILRLYKDLEYEVVEYEINEEDALVVVKVNVYDLKKAKTNAYEYYIRNEEEFYTNNVFDEEKYIYYELSEMFKTKEKVIETLNIKLTKENGIWKVNTLSEKDILKLHGLY